MMKPLLSLAVLLLSAAIVPVPAGDDGFVPMFNGKDLTGWVNVNGAPGTFYVKDDQIITTGQPTGYLRTAKQYENFIAEFDWMHIPNKPGAYGNSGFFVWADPIPAVGTGYTRGIEVQVLVNLTYRNKKGEVTASSHGDLFSIWGAKCVPDRPHPDGAERCLPSENRAKGEREWNHYRVEANDGRITLAVNGKVVSGVSKCVPRKGYLALESEGSECRFKNLKIKELPSTNPRPEEICNVDQGFKCMYTGLDLSGWKADDEAKKHWQPRDTKLHYDGKGGALTTERKYGNVEYIADLLFPASASEPCTFTVRDGLRVTVTPAGKVSYLSDTGNGAKMDAAVNPPGRWNRLSLIVRGNELRIAYGNVVQTWKDAALPAEGTLTLQPGGAMDFANLFVRELK
jgi:hypothetical protein